MKLTQQDFADILGMSRENFNVCYVKPLKKILKIERKLSI
jgi:hypothetical protein